MKRCELSSKSKYRVVRHLMHVVPWSSTVDDIDVVSTNEAVLRGNTMELMDIAANIRRRWLTQGWGWDLLQLELTPGTPHRAALRYRVTRENNMSSMIFNIKTNEL